MKFLSFLGFLAIVSGQSNNEKAQSLDFWIKISGKKFLGTIFEDPMAKVCLIHVIRKCIYT